MRSASVGFVALVAMLPATARAADFYVDPQNGSMSGDGSSASPWKTIQEVIDAGLVESQGWDSLPYSSSSKLTAKNAGAPVKAGDTIWLRSGYEGELSINGYHNAGIIRIAAEPGATPKLSHISIRSSSNWHIVGLSVSPEYAPSYDPQPMIQLDQPAYSGPLHDVIVEGCKLASKADVSQWTMSDWDTLSANGIQAAGDNVTIRGNQLKNVNFGLSISATHSLIENNVVDSFAGDGMRGLGDYTTFQYNLVKNCYDVNANHDDGFQSWSVGDNGVGTGEVKGIVLRGNVILNYEDENQPFRGTLQGIGCFDGMFVDWVIENNVIMTDHWHGITLLGAKNSRIVNNTVLDLNDQKPGPPWISIDNHKDGTPPTGCLVRNNLTTDLQLASSGVTEDHNIILQDPAQFFVDVQAHDLHLLQNAPAVDQGTSDQAPTFDIEGIPRPQGGGFDVGAYEWHDPSVVPPDAGLGGSGAATGTGGGGGTGGGIGGSSASSSDEDSGCGCRSAGLPRSPGAFALLALTALGLGARRRRR